MREMYEKSGVDIQKFFKPEQRNDEYLATFLEQKDLLPLLPSEDGGAAGGFAKQVEKMIQSDQSPQAILRWIEVRSDVFFCLFYCVFLLFLCSSSVDALCC